VLVFAEVVVFAEVAVFAEVTVFAEVAVADVAAELTLQGPEQLRVS
jgi:hypothetical protein